MPFIPPMLATRLEDPRRLADPRYSAEPKLDGQRALAMPPLHPSDQDPPPIPPPKTIDRPGAATRYFRTMKFIARGYHSVLRELPSVSEFECGHLMAVVCDIVNAQGIRQGPIWQHVVHMVADGSAATGVVTAGLVTRWLRSPVGASHLPGGIIDHGQIGRRLLRFDE
jgi:hypothetical protein